MLGALAVLTASCGDAGRTGGPASPGGGATALTVSGTDATGERYTWRLSCDPPGGDHPDAAEACRVLAANGDRSLPPVPKGQMCSQVYGGPDQATVTGTWRGQPVSSTFRRTDGCESARWDALVGLLPRPGA